ncbi:MAG: Trp biosynthesis-associated membrane protein, partial [Dermatophilaceae bacterium]
MGFGGLGALVGARRWNGLSSRYDAPVAGRAPQLDSAVEGGRRRESEWDQLSRGEDPTAEP